MPIEALALTMQPSPFDRCPQCHAEPFTPFMRGQVWRKWWQCRDGWTAMLRGTPFDYCAVICADCKEIVGWERPHDLSELMIRFEQQEECRRLIREWQDLGKKK